MDYNRVEISRGGGEDRPVFCGNVVFFTWYLTPSTGQQGWAKFDFEAKIDYTTEKR